MKLRLSENLKEYERLAKNKEWDFIVSDVDAVWARLEELLNNSEDKSHYAFKAKLGHIITTAYYQILIRNLEIGNNAGCQLTYSNMLKYAVQSDVNALAANALASDEGARQNHTISLEALRMVAAAHKRMGNDQMGHQQIQDALELLGKPLGNVDEGKTKYRVYYEAARVAEHVKNYGAACSFYTAVLDVISRDNGQIFEDQAGKQEEYLYMAMHKVRCMVKNRHEFEAQMEVDELSADPETRAGVMLNLLKAKVYCSSKTPDYVRAYGYAQEAIKNLDTHSMSKEAEELVALMSAIEKKVPDIQRRCDALANHNKGFAAGPLGSPAMRGTKTLPVKLKDSACAITDSGKSSQDENWVTRVGSSLANTISPTTQPQQNSGGAMEVDTSQVTAGPSKDTVQGKRTWTERESPYIGGVDVLSPRLKALGLDDLPQRGL